MKGVINKEAHIYETTENLNGVQKTYSFENYCLESHYHWVSRATWFAVWLKIYLHHANIKHYILCASSKDKIVTLRRRCLCSCSDDAMCIASAMFRGVSKPTRHGYYCFGVALISDFEHITHHASRSTALFRDFFGIARRAIHRMHHDCVNWVARRALIPV